MTVRIIISLMLILSGSIAMAEGGADDIRVSLLTARAGADIYQLEGHTALRIQSPDRGDYVINWGLFDFAAPNFVYRFVKGETDYMAGAAPTDRFLEMYRREGRVVVEQALNLTPFEKLRVIELTDNNLMPANRVYRYNYVLDNCATRPLAVIERAICDTLSLGATSLPAKSVSTFRNAMRHYHVNYPWYQFGIDLALGSGIDRRISSREMSFAPEALEQMMSSAERRDGAKLVEGTSVLVGAEGESPVLPPTPWYLAPMFWCSIVLLVSICVSVGQIRRKSPGVASKIFDTLFYLAMGLAGCVIIFLVVISVHEATSPNWLLLWLNPLCFIPVMAVWVKRMEKLLFSYQILNFASLIVLLILFGCGVQSPNAAFIPLIVADGVRALSCIKTNRNA
ncbi:DUF4105 domain-containing protein [uncultured Duncaniella sp.]|uniref:lipoprotein N-acyltransferase Lnb domain-containing protein n=1 Tax=uncultured Duncaniella sp. TaxID=2768039 RepID=UPI0025E3F045|nr:DUF4105 domain-containing protein [uncultured Duncaniella sp.]